MLEEDLTEFEDYLKEFESGVFFDSEICPTCGINLSDSLSPSNRTFVKVKFESIDKKTLRLVRLGNPEFNFMSTLIKTIQKMN